VSEASGADGINIRWTALRPHLLDDGDADQLGDVSIPAAHDRRYLSTGTKHIRNVQRISLTRVHDRPIRWDLHTGGDADGGNQRRREIHRMGLNNGVGHVKDRRVPVHIEPSRPRDRCGALTYPDHIILTLGPDDRIEPTSDIVWIQCA